MRFLNMGSNQQLKTYIALAQYLRAKAPQRPGNYADL